MKKIFKLRAENKNPDRMLEATKHEIRKYIKREKKKKLPEDVDFWKFECKFAQNEDEPKEIDFINITELINEAYAKGCDSFYIEIISTKGYRQKAETKDSEIIAEEE